MTAERREPVHQDERSEDLATERARRSNYPEELYGAAGTIEGRVGPCDPVNVPDAARPVAEALGLDDGVTADQRRAECEAEQERERTRARTKV